MQKLQIMMICEYLWQFDILIDTLTIHKNKAPKEYVRGKRGGLMTMMVMLLMMPMMTMMIMMRHLT